MFGLRAPRPRRAWLAAALFLLALSPGVWGVLDGMRTMPRGVNDAGAEFEGPLWDGPLTLSSPAALDALAQRGIRIVRLPFRWEQMQPALNGELSPPAVESLRGYLREAHARGMQVILDPHNFARYTTREGAVGIVGDPAVPNEAFADFWRRMSREFRGDPAIYAYGLMNEPNNIVTKHWERASQAAVDAIRAEGDGTKILVPGSNYSSSYIWVHCHGRKAWIRDPLDNFAYEAHCYFDKKGSGHYEVPYEDELAADPEMLERTAKRLQIFVEWCESNGVEGFLGEFGAPRDPRWLAHLERFMEIMDDAHMGGTAWSAGERWPATYPMNLQPGAHGDPPQLGVVLAHPGEWSPKRIPGDFRRGYRVLKRRTTQTLREARDAFHYWRISVWPPQPAASPR